MSKKKIANILSSVANICVMTAAFSAVTGGAPMNVQKLWIGLTGFVWCVSGYIWGYEDHDL